MALFLGPRCAPVSSSAQAGPGQLSMRYYPGRLPGCWLFPTGWRSVPQLPTGWCARFPFSGSRIFLSLPRVIPVWLFFFFNTSLPFFFHPTILPSFAKTSLSVANFAKCLPVQKKCLTLKSRAGLASKASPHGPSLVQPCTQIPKASSSLFHGQR